MVRSTNWFYDLEERAALSTRARASTSKTVLTDKKEVFDTRSDVPIVGVELDFFNSLMGLFHRVYNIILHTFSAKLRLTFDGGWVS